MSPLEVLTQLVRSPGHRIAESDAHRLGLDVEILDEIFQSNVKPYLNDVLEYQDLAGLDPREGRSKLWLSRGYESWDDVLYRYDIIAKYPHQVVKVLQAKLWTSKQDTNLHLAVYLSREGNWVVWHKRCDNQRDDSSGREYLAKFTTVAAMCADLNEIITDESIFNYRFGLEHLPEYVPLRIAHGLLELIAATIKQREADLASFKSAHKAGSDRLGLIEFKRRLI